MALLHSRQLDHNFTGSYNLSGSSQSLISNQVVVGSNLGSAVAHPSASMTVLLGDKKGLMIPSGSSDPSSLSTTEEGMMFYNTDDSILKIFDGTAWIPAGDINTKNTHLSMSADIDGDGANSTIIFRIDGVTDSNVKLRLKSDDAHEMTGSLNLSSDLTLGGRVQGDLRVTGDVLAETYIVSSSITYLTQSFASGSHMFGDTLDDTHEFTGSMNVTGSSTLLGTATVTTPLTSSTAISTNNIQNGYPSANLWGSNLGGSYFNNFDNTTHVSEILRFMSGVLSHSLDVSDAFPNLRTYASVDSNENSLGSTSTIGGYLPLNFSSIGDDEIDYLNAKGLWATGSTAFSGIDVYTNSAYYVDFDSNASGLPAGNSASSSADSDLMGLGGLTNSAATEFAVRLIVTQSFSDTGSVAAPDESTATFTTQSYHDFSVTSFGTSNGLNLNQINTVQPAVIPAAYQDGKFTNVGSGSRKYHASNNSWTSISSSGYYRFHDLKVGIKTGSQSDYTFFDGSTKNNFYAPISTIDAALPSQTIADTGTTVKQLTATSRSLSGVPYLIDATWEMSSKITGLFNPAYAASTTLVNMTAASVGTGTAGGSVSLSGDTVSTSGGTIQTATKVYSNDGASARSTGTIPYYNDIVLITGSVSFDSGNSDSIDQTGVADTTFTVALYGRDKDSSNSTLDTQTIYYHSASAFSQPTASGSLAIYGRAQGYDGGALAGTSEAFSGEDFRIVLDNNVLAFNGTAWTTTYALNQLGNFDLQVKPGYLADPGGDYRYWFPASYGSGAYKFYIRRFQTSGTKTSMTVDIGKTLVNWNATTADSAAVALLFKSSASGSGTNAALSTARIYDPSDLTSNVIETGVSADNIKNPFTDNLDLYGNTGGSKSSTEYTVPMRNSDGMYLDSNDNEFYVIVRYKGDVTPVTSITISTS